MKRAINLMDPHIATIKMSILKPEPYQANRIFKLNTNNNYVLIDLIYTVSIDL